MEGRMLGNRGLGRPRVGMLDELIEKETYGAMKRRTEDRSAFRTWTPRTCCTAE